MGLKAGLFADEIARRPPKSMEDLRARVAEFIVDEDMQDTRRKARVEWMGAEPPVPKPSGKPHADKSANRPKGPRFDSYTPLNAPRAKILQEAFSADSLPPPRRKPPPPRADGGKHCAYHRMVGHTTEQCHTLRDRIEELIRAGELKQ